MLSWQLILMLVTLIFLFIASYTDLKRREVPDWLNYGLVFSGLGLRFLFSFDGGWGIFLNGLLGFSVCFGIAYLFYYTNQWGGGDSKLLMGMGAVIGLGFKSFSLSDFDFSLFLFFIGLLLVGAIFGLFWCLGLAVKKRQLFFLEFKKVISSNKKWHFGVLLLGVGFLVVSLFFDYAWPLAIFPIGGFYLLCFIRGAEKSCFVKEVGIDKLVEGDWLAEEVVVNGEENIGKGKSLAKKDLWKIKNLFHEGKIKKILIKDGIPFVPSFLLSYILVVFSKEVIGFLSGF